MQRRGFTLVELLIVIVVIGILAAIMIVAYQGVQGRALTAQVEANIEQVGKKLESYKVTSATGANYPADIASAQAAIGSSPVITTYLVDNAANPQNYCATMTSGSVSYSVSSTSNGAMPGICVTNFEKTPNSEGTPLPYSQNSGGSGTVALSTANKHSGNSSTLVTKNGAWIYVHINSGSNLSVAAGDTVFASCYVYSSIGKLNRVPRGTGITYSANSITIPTNTWVEVSRLYTVPSGVTDYAQDFGWEASDVPDGSTLYVDDCMMIKNGPYSDYQYADGNSPGWFWTGNPNNSISIGPVVAQ